MIDHLQEVQRRTATNEDLLTPAPTLVGRFAYDVATDQPTAELPRDVLDEVTKALFAGQTHYVDVPGIGRLRELLADHLRATERADVAADAVVVTAGIQEARFLAVQVLSETYPVVAVPEVVHPGIRNALGVRRPNEVLRLPTAPEDGYLAPIAAIEEMLEAGAKLLVLETPSRLSGATYDAESIRTIADLLAKHDAHAIIDTGFAAWSDVHVPSLALQPNAEGRVTSISEAVPGVGLEAWSLGVLAAGGEHLAGITKLKQIMSICTSTPSQLAAIELFDRGLQDVTELRRSLAEARREAVARAMAVGARVVPGNCANVLAVDGIDGTPVGAADGSAFGAPGVARLRIDGDAASVILGSLPHGANGGVE